jgi:hypothetical protein
LHYFGKRAATLDAAEAVWLASLLRNPEAELERAAQAFDPAACRRSPGRLRPLPRWRREDLQLELGQVASAAGGQRARRPSDGRFVGYCGGGTIPGPP